VVAAHALVDALDVAGYRLTRPRRDVAELIAMQEGHFTAADLLSAATSLRRGIGRATVFRTIEVLGELGLIERIELPDGEHAYVVCATSHHHHVVCTRCGDATEVSDFGLDSVLASVARRTGYSINAHRMELFGLCPACQEQAAPA
jgi:Fe2+ or Zn2+ uptake regulation protein